MLQYSLLQSKDTEALGAHLASLCPKQCVIFLKGPLGSGKTTLARGFLQQLGDFKRVKSPTYTLVESYSTLDRHILHFDLYRLHDPMELESIGIRDYTQDTAIWLVEWPERAILHANVSLLPPPDLTVLFALESDSNSHTAQFLPSSRLGEKLLNQLRMTKKD